MRWKHSNSSIGITPLWPADSIPARILYPGQDTKDCPYTRIDLEFGGLVCILEILDPGSKTLDAGSWIQDPGSRILDPGSWILHPGSRVLDPASRIKGPGSCIQDQGSRLLDPGSRMPGCLDTRNFEKSRIGLLPGYMKF